MSRKSEVIGEVREKNQEYSVGKKYGTISAEKAGRQLKGTRKLKEKKT